MIAPRTLSVVTSLSSLAFAASLLTRCAPPPEPPRAIPPAVPAPVVAPPPPRCLSVVGWSDMHGQLSPDDPVVSTGRVPAGGVVAIADELSDVRRTGDTVVVLDAGDLFTGPLASTLAEGEPIIEAYRILGVDAAAIGNHEFDFGPVGYDRITAAPGVGDEAGPAGPRGALLARIRSASFPFLAANITRAGGAPTGWPNHHPSTRIARDGFDVGVVGYTTAETPATTLAPNVVGLDFKTDAAAHVGAAIRELRAAGSFPIVLLAHASIEGTLPESIHDNEPHHGEIERLLEGLGADKPDLIIAGHRHAWAVGRVRGVPFVSSDQHGVGLSRVRYCPNAAGKLELGTVERHVALWSGAPRSELGARVAAAVAPWEAKVAAVAEAVVATIPKECSAKALNGTALGDQVGRATAERIGDAAPVPAGVPVVGFTNVGALRAPLAGGTVRYTDLFTVFPFENSVGACGTTRAGLVRFIENAIRKDSSRERFPLGVSGAKLVLKRAADGRLTLVSLTLDGEKKPGRDDAPVWLALSDFVLEGGDNLLTGVSCTPKVTSQTRVREAWKALLARERACDGPSLNVRVE